jgi:hypothetical protein
MLSAGLVDIHSGGVVDVAVTFKPQTRQRADADGRSMSPIGHP